MDGLLLRWLLARGGVLPQEEDLEGEEPDEADEPGRVAGLVDESN